jgi:hypothetical protein
VNERDSNTTGHLISRTSSWCDTCIGARAMRNSCLPLLLAVVPSITSALVGCGVEPAPASPHSNQGGTITVVDPAGRPVPGAHVDLVQTGGDIPCNLDHWSGAAYVFNERTVADERGQVAWGHGGYARAVDSDRAAGWAKVVGDTTIVVRPTFTVTIQPTCDGARCGTFEASWGSKMAMGESQCDVAMTPSADGRVVLQELAAGDLTLYLGANGEDTDDTRYAVVHAHIDRDVTLTPVLPRVAGPYVVRGTITIDGRAPGGPDYATSVSVQCGDAPTHYGKLDAATGQFFVAHLPARECTLHVHSDATELRRQRDTTIHPDRSGPLAISI